MISEFSVIKGNYILLNVILRLAVTKQMKIFMQDAKI